jgi:hypothetical protein
VTAAKRGLSPTLLAVLASLILLPIGGWFAWRALSPPAPESSASPLASDSASSSLPVPATPEQNPDLYGKILDAEGNPVSGATVRVVGPAPPYSVLHDTTSDQAGAFGFAHLATGRVLVVADRDPAGFVSSAVLDVTAGQGTEVTLVLSSTSGVRGTVVDDARRPVAGATLTVEGMPWTVPTTTSNGAGTFRLIVVPNEARAIAVEASGYETAHVPLSNRQAGSDLVLTIRLEASKGDAAPAEVANGSIEGEVVDERGFPVTSFTIGLQTVDGARRTDIGGPRKVDDAHGAFRLDRLAPASYVLTATAAGKPSKRSEPIVLQSGGAVSGVRLVLAPGGSVSGIVSDRSHVPVAGADVFFETPEGEVTVTTKTDSQGRYHIDQATPGALNIRVEKPGFRMRRFSGLQVRSGLTLDRDVVLAPAPQNGEGEGRPRGERPPRAP